jgi:hypothetical protein
MHHTLRTAFLMVLLGESACFLFDEGERLGEQIGAAATDLQASRRPRPSQDDRPY